MRALLLSLALTTLVFALPASAQEGCKTTQSSCTQMNQRCEQACDNARDKTVCAARLCATPFARCKGTGTWQSVGSQAACWKTNNRS